MGADEPGLACSALQLPFKRPVAVAFAIAWRGAGGEGGGDAVGAVAALGAGVADG